MYNYNVLINLLVVSLDILSYLFIKGNSLLYRSYIDIVVSGSLIGCFEAEIDKPSTEWDRVCRVIVS